MSENQNRFQVAVLGQSPYGAYAFQVDGNVALQPRYLAANGDKKSMCTVRIGVNRNAWELLGMAEERDPKKYADKEETTFMNVTFWGAAAERAAKLEKGMPIMASGKMVRETYQFKGEDVEAVAIRGNHFEVRRDDTTPSGIISGVMRTGDKESPMACIAACKVASIGSVEATPNGIEYIDVPAETLTPIDRAWDLAQKAWESTKKYEVTKVKLRLWERQKRAASLLKPGMVIFVTGQMSVYNGDYTISVAQLDLPVQNSGSANAPATAAPAQDEKSGTPAGAKPKPARGRKKKEDTPPETNPADDAGDDVPPWDASDAVPPPAASDDDGSGLPFELPF